MLPWLFTWQFISCASVDWRTLKSSPKKPPLLVSASSHNLTRFVAGSSTWFSCCFWMWFSSILRTLFMNLFLILSDINSWLSLILGSRKLAVAWISDTLKYLLSWTSRCCLNWQITALSVPQAVRWRCKVYRYLVGKARCSYGFLSVDKTRVAVSNGLRTSMTCSGSTSDRSERIGGRCWNFFAKSAGRCFTPVMEIKPNRVSLRWNFYADVQFIRGRFWLQFWTLKKFSEPCVSWKYLAKMWKNSEMTSAFAATLMGAAYYGSGGRALLCVSVYSLSIA